MKNLLMVVAVFLIIIWAVMFFIFKIGDVAHILLAIAGIIILFRFSMNRVIT
jgi:hypothetical protein